MLDAIRDFFERHIGATAAQPSARHPIELATAALLVEVMRSDASLPEAERTAVLDAMQAKFGIGADEAATLVTLAEEEVRLANDYYQFTSLINRVCDYAQKISIIEKLWHVAMIDGHLDAHELHLMRKLADLLHVGHADYLAAKQRARESANLPQ
jgi:uncharacterized tellurite resistance protein B-like protein